MELIWIVIGIIAVILAVKVAVFVIRGALKLAAVVGMLALFFYLITNVNMLSLLH